MGQACVKCIMRITVKDATTMTEGVLLLPVDEQDGERFGLRSRVSQNCFFKRKKNNLLVGSK